MTDQTIIAGDDAGEVVAPDDNEATEARAAQETEDQDTDAEASEAEADESEDDEGDGTEEEPEEIEFNFNGKKLRIAKSSIPDELAAEVSQFVKGAESATSKKLQELSGRAKALDAREQAVEKLISLQGDALNTYSRGLMLRQEIDRLTQIVSDDRVPPEQAQRAMFELQRKQIEFNNVVNDVSAKESDLSRAIAADREQRSTEGKAVLERSVKDFDSKKSELFDFVTENTSIPREIVERDYAINPEITLAFYEQMLFRRLQAKAKQATAKPKPNAPANPVTPMKAKGGKASLDLVRDADKMSADEWARRRNQQLAKQGRR